MDDNCKREAHALIVHNLTTNNDVNTLLHRREGQPDRDKAIQQIAKTRRDSRDKILEAQHDKNFLDAEQLATCLLAEPNTNTYQNDQ